MPHVKRDPSVPLLRKDRNNRPAKLLGPCRKCGANERASSGYGGCLPCRRSPEARVKAKERRDRPEAKAWQKAWRASEKGLLLDKTSLLRRHYGLSYDEYLGLLQAQRNMCAACGDPMVQGNKRKSAHVDHCHTTGKVRGILCRECNMAEGMLETPERAESLAAYLRKSITVM